MSSLTRFLIISIHVFPGLFSFNNPFVDDATSVILELFTLGD